MCDGWYDVVICQHFQLMVTFRWKVILNLPYFLNSLLHETALRLKRSEDKASVVSHYGLIKPIVFIGLNQVQLSWEYFLGNHGAPSESEAPIEFSGNILANSE